MTLCHNETLDWVDSATDAPRNGGLNAFGRAVIGELNRLGIVIDLAHVSHDGMRRVLDVDRGAGRAVALQRLRAVRPSAQRARRRAEAAEGQRRPRDGDLRAGVHLAAAARLAPARARRLRQGAAGRRPEGAARRARGAARPGAEGDARTRSPTTSNGSPRRPGVDHVGIGSDYFGGAAAAGPRKRQPVPASLRRAGAARVLRARSREDVVAPTWCACCAGSRRSASGCERRARPRSAGSRIIRARNGRRCHAVRPGA